MNRVIDTYSDWMMSRGYLAPSSVSAYAADIASFEAYLCDYRRGYSWSMVTRDDIEEYIAFLVSKKIEFSSICRALSALSSFFRWCKHLGKRSDNPCDGVQRPRPKYHQREALDMNVIREVLAQDNLSDSTRALIALICESGLRIGECLSLCPADINIEYRQVRVLGKGRVERIAFFGECAADALSRYMNGRTFPSKLFPMSRRQYNWDIYHACKPFCGEHKCSPHILRHTFATECLAKGMPMDVLMLTLGHKSIDTTMLYVHCQSTRTEKFNRFNSARI